MANPERKICIWTGTEEKQKEYYFAYLIHQWFTLMHTASVQDRIERGQICQGHRNIRASGVGHKLEPELWSV